MLGDEYLADLEAAYPPGTVLRRRFIEGLRGLSVVGEPVYGGYFQRQLHVGENVEMNREAAFYEGWDFGHRHPCVVWAQFLPQGALHILGGVTGAALFIEDFAPIALQYRTQWCPHPLDVLSTGDPAGVSFSPHGVSMSAVDVLRVNGVKVETAHGANSVDRRDVAIQTLAGYMRRPAGAEPAFRLNPRFVVVSRRGSQLTPVLVDGFEAGYAWDTRSTTSAASPNTRRPMKDGYYDHSQNCVEYIVLKFGPTAPTQKQTMQKELAYQPCIHHGPDSWMV